MKKKESKSFEKSAWVNAPTAEERAQMVSKLPKKAYVRKTKTKAQKDAEELKAMTEYLEAEKNPIPEPEPELIQSVKEWDVPKTEKIKYFDPSLSYELTGYRPITKDKGLDFDPKAFTEAADHYRKFGRYTDYYPDTYKWQQHWTEEIRRCTYGYTVGKYTITGQNYFFLNYYRLLSPIVAEGSVAQRAEDFPIFVNKQYEYFHYLDMCKKAGYDGLAFKSRGVGASEIAASNCAHAFTFIDQSNNVVTAFLEKYVKDTLSKVWQEFDFLDSCTEGALGLHKQKTNTLMKKVASTVDQDGVEAGKKSIVEGITADTPDKLRGGRTENIYFEESGNNPCLISTYERGEALVRILGRRVGNRFVFGTSQDMGPAVEGLKKMFYNPRGYTMLPFYNTSMANGEPQMTGYFIPSYSMWFGGEDGEVGFDERGVVDEERAKKYYLDQWAQIDDPQSLLIKKSEYCFTPEDAFIMEGENRFDREKLADQLAAIEIHKIVEKPKKAKLIWPMDGDNCDRTQRPMVQFDNSGKIEIAELPLCDSAGVPFKNLYCVGCLTPGEKVLTQDGLKKVEDVTLDDKLYSINGKPVNIINLQQYQKEDENIYKVKLNNIFSTTTFTGEHPIYCATPKQHYHGGAYAQKHGLHRRYYVYDFRFKLMKDVKVGDFVKVPNIYKHEKPIPWEKWDESNIRIDQRVGNPLGNKDFWWLVGLILGDGWCATPTKNRPCGCVGIAFNLNETFYIEKAKRIISEVLNRHVKSRQKGLGNSAEVLFNCQQFWNFFKENFGIGAKNKNLPEWVKFLPNDLKMNLIVGYFSADGCLCKSRDSYNAVSCSLKLLEDMQDILFSLGIISTVHWMRSTKKVHQITSQQRLSVVNQAWTLDVHGDMINKFKRMYSAPDLKLDKWEYKTYTDHAIPRCFFEDETCNYIYIKISEIEVSKYTGIVYNYHCETSTFMCHYIPTHNCDSIDGDSTTSTGQDDVSQFAVVVFRRAYGLQQPKIVATYKDRPKDVKTAYDNALKLCKFYNAPMLMEATRVSVKQYFERFGALSYMMHRPQATANSSGKTNFKQFGVPATPTIIDHQLDLIQQYITDYCETIQFPAIIDELLRYSYANKRKFDYVAALGMALLADEEMINKVVKTESRVKLLGNVGYYRDEYGRVQYGEVKQTNNSTMLYGWSRKTYY